MTRIAIVASGSRGDVQPYIALGKGLQATGFEVRVLTSIDFEGLVRGAGLAFCSTGASIEAIIQSDEWRQTIEGGSGFKLVRGMLREMKARAESVAEVLPDLLADADLLVGGLGGMMGAFSVAEKLGLPAIQAYVIPITPTGAFASPIAPRPSLGGGLNRASFHMLRQILWQTGRAGDAATRRALGMPRPSLFGPYARMERAQTPLLYGFSRHVLPPPADWPTNHHITGYWFLDQDTDWTPPADLLDFLQAGDPPVYIGFGSMVNREPEQVAAIVLQALERSGQRGVISAGWGGLTAASLPDTVYMTGSIPHSWLFPRMAAVVHHGGAGTTAAGLRAGVPSIVVPFMADQPFWGQRVAALGVGPQPVPRKKLTVEALAVALEQAAGDAAMRQRARDLGERIHHEGGVQNAVALIEQQVVRTAARQVAVP